MAKDVPRIIWQTHEWSYEDLPDNFKKSTMTWRNLNLGWDYRYVSAAERATQVEAFSKELYLFYLYVDKVSQADIWRYVIVLENGGFYADMDSVCLAPLDFILEQAPLGKEVIATELLDDGGINNANFGAVQDSNCMSEVVSDLLAKYQETYLITILTLVEEGLSFPEAVRYQLRIGPGLYASALKSCSDQVWNGYTGALHKNYINAIDWHPDYEVDYYGESKQYLDLVQENSWSLT